MIENDSGKKIFRVGILGYGTVGSGVAQVLLESRPTLKEKTGLDIRLHKIAEKDEAKLKEARFDRSLWTDDARKVIQDPSVDIVVEVIGGIEPARTFVKEALAAGKFVVTANKALLATHGQELFEAALAAHSAIGFEASVCGGVPIIGAIRDGLVANRIDSLCGILNGTTNYILTRMLEEGASYADALKEAQSRGYAEANPALDVTGGDAAHKLVLLANLSFHSIFHLSDVHTEGIDKISLEDVRYASELGYTLKLLAIARRREEKGAEGVELRVHPALIPRAHPLASVRDVFNAVLVRGDATGEVMFYGRGAGKLPTASAIVADIVDAARGSASQTFTKLQFFQKDRPALPVVPMAQVQSRYYVHFRVTDRPGVMGKLAAVLGEHEVSIASLIQKDQQANGEVSIIILTHQTLEERFRRALKEIEALPFVRQPSRFIRVGEG
jgi:homoserine dehydrogenase